MYIFSFGAGVPALWSVSRTRTIVCQRPSLIVPELSKEMKCDLSLTLKRSLPLASVTFHPAVPELTAPVPRRKPEVGLVGSCRAAWIVKLSSARNCRPCVVSYVVPEVGVLVTSGDKMTYDPAVKPRPVSSFVSLCHGPSM